SARGLRDVGRVQLNTDVAASKSPRDDTHGSRAKKRIEHEIVPTGGGKDARLHKSLRKGGNMGAARIGRIDAPDRATVSFTSVLGTLLHGFMVVGVLLAL